MESRKSMPTGLALASIDRGQPPDLCQEAVHERIFSLTRMSETCHLIVTAGSSSGTTSSGAFRDKTRGNGHVNRSSAISDGTH